MYSLGGSDQVAVVVASAVGVSPVGLDVVLGVLLLQGVQVHVGELCDQPTDVLPLPPGKGCCPLTLGPGSLLQRSVPAGCCCLASQKINGED